MSAYVSFLTVLGWSLLDSIWQMAVLWIAYYMLTAGNIRISSAGKHNLILVFVFIGAEWFVYTLIHLSNESEKPFFAGFYSRFIFGESLDPLYEYRIFRCSHFPLFAIFQSIIKWSKK